MLLAMNYLIISDTHLGPQFDKPVCDFLTELIQQYDQVIIVGDLWEGYLWRFDDFVKSPWSGLFPLLKQKQATYIHGNHDHQGFVDERVKLFSDSSLNEFTLNHNQTTYHFEHGHKYHLTQDLLFKVPLLPWSIQSLIFRANLVITDLNLRQTSEDRNVFNGNEDANILIKKLIRPTIAEETWYVCGHTHFPELDTEQRFANSGRIRRGYGSYLTLTEQGLQLHTTQI